MRPDQELALAVREARRRLARRIPPSATGGLNGGGVDSTPTPPPLPSTQRN